MEKVSHINSYFYTYDRTIFVGIRKLFNANFCLFFNAQTSNGETF
jgi:hypothetical protein